MKFGRVQVIRLLKLMPGKKVIKEYYETFSLDFSVYITGCNAY